MESCPAATGTDTEPSMLTPRLAELLAIFSAKLSCSALTKPMLSWPSLLSGTQVTRMFICTWRSGWGWKLFCPSTVSWSALFTM